MIFIIWRQLWESNPLGRFCRPLPNRSAKSPIFITNIIVTTIFDNVKSIYQIYIVTIIIMNDIISPFKDKYIALITIIIGFIFVSNVNFADFKFNTLNYSIALALSATVFVIRSVIFTLQESVYHQKSKNWFGFGFEILMTITQFGLLLTGIKILINNSNPLNTIWYFLICSLVYFAQVYISKKVTLFRVCLFELAVLALVTATLRFANWDFITISQTTLLWAGASYIILVSSVISYFRTIQKLFLTKQL
jgi:hypothetical protein